MKKILGFLLFALSLSAQQNINGSRVIEGDLTVNGLFKIPVSSSAPSGASCDESSERGRFYIQTGDSASVRTQIYVCVQIGASSYAWENAAYKRGTATPTTCATGDLFFDTDATAGQNLFGCTATNTWTLLTGGGGGGNTTTTVSTSDPSGACTSGTRHVNTANNKSFSCDNALWSQVVTSTNTWANPSWLTSLDWAKITGAPTFGDVTAAAAFGNDNRALRSDGTGKGVQASPVVIDDDGTVTSGDGTKTNGIVLFELSANGGNYVGFYARDSISANTCYFYPLVNGTSGQVLSLTGTTATTTEAVPKTCEILQWSTVASGGGVTKICNLLTTETNTTGGGPAPSITCTIPANSLTAGKVIRVHASGLASTPSVSQFRYNLQLGGTDLWSADLTSVPTQAGSAWGLDTWVQVRTIGASGTVVGGGFLHVRDTDTAAGESFGFKTSIVPANITTVNTTVDLTVKLDFTFTVAASRSWDLTSFIVTVE